MRGMAPGEPLAIPRRVEAVESDHGGRLGGELRHKPHLLFTWLADLVRHPAILDAVEAVLGPNLLVWHASFFIKEARDEAFVSWHQGTAASASRSGTCRRTEAAPGRGQRAARARRR